MARKPALKVPPILLEGDHPSPPPISGPGEKFTLGPTPVPQQPGIEAADLPETYGTGRLFLTARDPHWLYANWDLPPAEQSRYNAQSEDGHLILRTFTGSEQGRAVSESHVHPESRHWFVPVERAATKYVVELGYYRSGHEWKSVATSAPTPTPPDTWSPDLSATFATIPVDVPLPELVALVKQAALEHLPLAAALEELRRSGQQELSPAAAAAETIPEWTAEQERALAEIIRRDELGRVWISSLEITDLVRQQFEAGVSSPGAEQLGLGLPSSLGEVSSVTSPFGGQDEMRKGFWFNVNAELIIYGATECNATVTIGGRKVALRPDGSFSFRFALPDGQYALPIIAVAADETDARAAEMKFSRATDYLGDVGAYPQDPSLKTPVSENA